MEKTIALFALLFYFIAAAFGQSYQSLVPYYNGYKYGYKNLDGKIIIKPQYDKASLFSDNIGLLEAYSDFSNSSYFEKTYPVQYFDQQLAIVSIDNKIALINEKGKLIHEPCECSIVKRYNTTPPSLWLRNNYNEYEEKKDVDKCALIYKSGNGVSGFLDYQDDYEGNFYGIMYIDTVFQDWTDVLYQTDTSSHIIGLNGELISKNNINILSRAQNGYYIANEKDSTYLYKYNTLISNLGKSSSLHNVSYAFHGLFSYETNENKIYIIDTLGYKIMEIEGITFQGFNSRGHGMYYNSKKDSSYVIDINKNILYSYNGYLEIQASVYGYTLDDFKYSTKYFNANFEEIDQKLYASFFEKAYQINEEKSKSFSIKSRNIKVNFDGELYRLIKGQDTVLCESFDWRYLSDIEQEYLVVHDQTGMKILNLDLEEKYVEKEYFQYQYLGNGNFTNYKNGFSIVENDKLQLDSTFISIKWKNKYVYAKKNTSTNLYTVYDHQLNQLASDVAYLGDNFGNWQTIVSHKEAEDSLVFTINGIKAKTVYLGATDDNFQRQIYLFYTNDNTIDDVSYFAVKNKYETIIYKFTIGNAFTNPIVKEFKEFKLTFRKETIASIDSMYSINIDSYKKNVNFYLNNNKDKNVYIPPFTFYKINNVIDQKYCLELNCMVYDCLDLVSDKITKITIAKIDKVNGPSVKMGTEATFVSNGISYTGDISDMGTMAIPVTMFAEEEDQTYTIIDSTGKYLIAPIENKIILSDSGNYYAVEIDSKIKLYKFPSEYIGQYEHINFYGNFILINDSLLYDANMTRLFQYDSSYEIKDLGIWLNTNDKDYLLTKFNLRIIEKDEILNETEGYDYKLISDEILLDDMHDYKLAFLSKELKLISRYIGRIIKIDYANQLIYFLFKGEGILNFDGKLLIPPTFNEIRYDTKLQLYYGVSALTGATEYFKLK